MNLELKNLSGAKWRITHQATVDGDVIAQHGFLGPRTVFEGTHGFFYTFARNANGDFDIVTGVPIERLTIIGDDRSPIPWHTLLTGMLFIQIFYWSTNQNITQKAMAAPKIGRAHV